MMTVSKVKTVLWGLPVVLLVSGACAFFVFSLENKKAYNSAVSYFKQNQTIIKNKNYIAVIDYSKPSFVKRLFIYDLHTGNAETYLVAHGRESGFIFARDFSNDIDSHKSCTGFFTTGDVFIGEQGLSLLLHGLQEGLNNNAFERGIIIHGADYVSWKSILENWGRLGRSLGCPAVSTDIIHEVIDKLHDGALLYVHAP
jgi:hypothetical protein